MLTIAPSGAQNRLLPISDSIAKGFVLLAVVIFCNVIGIHWFLMQVRENISTGKEIMTRGMSKSIRK